MDKSPKQVQLDAARTALEDALTQSEIAQASHLQIPILLRGLTLAGIALLSIPFDE